MMIFKSLILFCFVVTFREIVAQSASSLTIAQEKCAEYAKKVKIIVKRQPLTADHKIVEQVVDLCGHRREPLVSGGTTTGESEFPHQVQLGITVGDMIDWKCGGTLISELYILTAAHCKNHGGSVVSHAWVGNYKVHDGKDLTSRSLFRVEQFINHPNYGGDDSTYNDIALAKLDRPVRLNKYNRPACLPTTFNGTEENAIVTGWGQLEFLGPTPEYLQKAKLEFFKYDDCSTFYSRDEGLPAGLDDRTQLCAGSRDSIRDSCQGDSGGPLQVYHRNEYCMYVVVGVTSLGAVCGTQTPGIYTRVYSYIDWIVGIVWSQ